MNRQRFCGWALCAVLGLAAIVGLAAVAEAFETKITDAAVFKNGYVFVLREGECTAEKSAEGLWAETKEVPQALLGTFWAYSLTEGVKVSEVKSGEEKVKEKVVARSLDELLLANLGRKVSLTLIPFGGSGEKERTVQLEGTLIFAGGRWEGEEPQADVAPPRDTRGYTQPVPRDPLLVLQTAEGLVTIPRQQVVSMLFAGAEPEQIRDYDRVSKEKRMRVVLEGQVESGAKSKVGLAYMTKGIRWIPAYQISLLDDKTCRLRLQANVVDDIENLEGATLHFVVGVPHFVTGDMLSPLSLREAFEGLSSYFQAAGTAAGAAMMSQAGGYGGGYPGTPAPMPPPAPGASEGLSPGPLPSPFEETGQLPAAGAEDLFLYEKQNVWLEKGERAMLDIFQAEAPYSHLYQWEITGDDVVPAEQRSGRQPPEQLAAELEKNKVWHCLKLENNTDMPWTTAAAMTMRDLRPLGQDMLNYTAIGDKATVKITIASDVGARKMEEEIDRQRQAITVYGNPYDLVTVRGILSLENFKKGKVAMEVSRTVVGEIKEATETAKISKAGTTLKGLNPTSVVKWEFELAPGEKRELTYVFGVYVPSRY